MGFAPITARDRRRLELAADRYARARKAHERETERFGRILAELAGRHGPTAVGAVIGQHRRDVDQRVKLWRRRHGETGGARAE